MSRRRFRYAISPLEALVLLRNVMDCPEAGNDADRTVSEICAEIDAFDGYLSRSVLESSLYCCNMQFEDKKFWHPHKWSFDKFVVDLLPLDQQFDKYYNIINEKVKDGLND
jgi:hypothetical protein